jgi:hypothetical protein
MKYFRLTILVLFSICVPCAFANSIPTYNITYVTGVMSPNSGAGENIALTFIGPGVNITTYAGNACFDWCTGAPIPDLSQVGVGQIFVGPFSTVTIGGQVYDSQTVDICCFFNSSGSLNAMTPGSGNVGDSYYQFVLTLPCCGGWDLRFSGGPGAYSFVGGTFQAGTPPAVTPEPGTMALMLTGLGGILTVIRKSCCHP